MAQEPAFTVAVQLAARSSHASVVHPSESLQVDAVVHAPPEVHAPHPVADVSTQRAPVRAVHAVELTDGSHALQSFAGLTAPATTQLVPTRQNPACAGLSQRSAASSQTSSVHATPSVHVFVEPTHAAAAVHVSSTVQNERSSHDEPVRTVHAVVLVAGRHSWQPLPGLSPPLG